MGRRILYHCDNFRFDSSLLKQLKIFLMIYILRMVTSRRDSALSTLGPSRIASGKLYTWFNVRFSSQGEFYFVTRLVTDRRSRHPSPVRPHLCHSVRINPAHLWGGLLCFLDLIQRRKPGLYCQIFQFATYFNPLLADIRPLGAFQESPRSRKSAGRSYGYAGRIRAEGGSDFTVGDFDSMPYLLAFKKVARN